MTSDEYFQELLIEEEELIQDYADNLLTPDECRKFEERFLISEQRRQKVKFAYSLSSYITRQEEPKLEKPTKAQAKKSGFFANLKMLFRQPVLIGAAILIVTGVSVFVFYSFYLNSSKDNVIIASLNKTLNKI